VKQEEKTLYSGFFSVEEKSGRTASFTIFVNARDVENAIEMLRQQLEAKLDLSWVDNEAKIYLDSIIEVRAPAIVAFVSKSKDGLGAVCLDVVAGNVESWGYGEENGVIEPFIIMKNGEKSVKP